MGNISDQKTWNNRQRLDEKVSLTIIIVRREIKRAQNLGCIWGRINRTWGWGETWAHEQKESAVGHWVD